MNAFRRIDGVGDLRSAAFVVYDKGAEPLAESVAGLIGTESVVLEGNAEAEEYLSASQPDIVFIGSNGIPRGRDRFSLCQRLRGSGFRSIVVLMTDDATDCGGISHITSEGYDNYLLATDSAARIRDTIHWAILNRKRRNKYAIQFDENPDAFYTVDREGMVYDINRGATIGSRFEPRDVVKRGITVFELGTLKEFRKIVRPRIKAENVGRVFTNTVDEVGQVMQVQTRVHNVPTIGLVATVVKTDITRSVYSHAMDILGNSIALLSQRDHYTAAHSSRVYYYATRVAGEMGCAADRRFSRALCFASLLHDIGKIGVKDHVLLKPGLLSPDEQRQLSSHPVKGCRMLRPYKFLRDAMDLVRSHHERPDGEGYPDGLGGEAIPLGASIIAVADCFDAMTTNRPYRRSLSYAAAMAEIEDNLGTQFDREAGRAFLSIIRPALVRDVRRLSRRAYRTVSQELINGIVEGKGEGGASGAH